MVGKAATALLVAQTLLRPTSPEEGPPLPGSWDVSWPGFFNRAITRLREEPPWETIPKYGLRGELKKEFEVVTGQKL